MPLNYEQERSNIDRRSISPERCEPQREKIEAQGHGLISIQSSMLMLKWVIGLSLPVWMVIAGTFYSLNADSLKAIALDTKELKAMVVEKMVIDGQLMQRIINVENDVNKIELQINQLTNGRVRK